MHTRFPPQILQGPPPVGKEIEYWVAQQLLNYQGGKPRVSLADLLAGSPGGIGSVLYDPDDEFFHDAAPRPEAFTNLIAQMDNVEAEVAGKVTVVRNPNQLARCLDSGERFLFHAVEGGFALGGIPDNATTLAARGVAYVIVAHLFYRGVAACENALPFVPDGVFNTVLNGLQPANTGLTGLGKQIVDKLLEAGIMVDITHANAQAQAEILQMARDHGNRPVISSHNGVRCTSNYPLNLSRETVLQIAASHGVVGIILYPHWLRQPIDQIFGPDGVELVFRAIDCIAEWTGGYDAIAIGSDLDGFIQPIKDCPNYAATPNLVQTIQAKYPKAADGILWRNARDVLARGWKGV